MLDHLLAVNAMWHNPGALQTLPPRPSNFRKRSAPLQDTYREISSSFPREKHERFPKTFSQLGVSQCSLPYRQRSIEKQKVTSFHLALKSKD